MTLSTQEQELVDAEIDTYLATNNADPADPVVTGSNVVVRDTLNVDNAWDVYVIGGDGVSPNCYVPAWGGLIMYIDLMAYVTDRAGPNGETMPVIVPPEEEPQKMMARGAAEDPAQQTAQASPAPTTARHKQKDFASVVREAVKKLPKDKQKDARAKLQAAGVFGKDEH